MTRARKRRKVKRVRLFASRDGSRTYRCTGRIYGTKRQATTTANKYRRRAKGNHARVVRASGGGYLVYRNPCGRPTHSKWHYINRAPKTRSLRQMKARAASRDRQEAAAWKEYLTRGY